MIVSNFFDTCGGNRWLPSVAITDGLPMPMHRPMHRPIPSAEVTIGRSLVEVHPLISISAESCCQALLHSWISRFGVPSSIISDRGAQFTSLMWKELNRLLGVKCQTTTAYHPQANGLVERFHRQLKASLMAVADDRGWMTSLPLVLLGLRTAWKHDLNSSPAEMVYGEELRLPGDFVTKSAFSPPSDFSSDLHARMSALRPSPTSAHLAPHAKPSDCALRRFSGIQWAYVRIDTSKPPLSRSR